MTDIFWCHYMTLYHIVEPHHNYLTLPNTTKAWHEFPDLLMMPKTSKPFPFTIEHLIYGSRLLTENCVITVMIEEARREYYRCQFDPRIALLPCLASMMDGKLSTYYLRSSSCVLKQVSTE